MYNGDKNRKINVQKGCSFICNNNDLTVRRYQNRNIDGLVVWIKLLYSLFKKSPSCWTIIAIPEGIAIIHAC